MDSFANLMNRTNLLVGKGQFDSAALVFLKALDINAEAAWDSLWNQTPWEFYVALLPPQLNRWNRLPLRSKIVSVRTLLYLRDFEYALPFIADLARLLPNHNLPLEFFAKTHAGMGHFYCALQYVERIENSSFFPEFEFPVSEDGINSLKLFKLDALFELGDDDTFERCIDEELFDNRNPSLLLYKSFWLRNIGRYEEGLALAEDSFALSSSSQALFQRGWFLRALGDPRADADFRTFLAMPSSPTHDYYLPFVHCYLGQRENACQAMLDYFVANPDSYQGYYLCAEIYSLLGDIPMAVDCLEQAFRNGLVSRAGLYADPSLQPLIADPEGSVLIRSHLHSLEQSDLLCARNFF